jgi:glutamate synthase domain-containing protein 2
MAMITRFTILQSVLVLTAVCAALGTLGDRVFYWPLVALVPLSLVGLHDVLQTRHSILRNYPVIGHIRFLFEAIRPEIRQYLIEDERDPVPYSREQRALVYQRSKNVLDTKPFGTVLDVTAPGYGWISHSIRPADVASSDFRVTVGGPGCTQPYSASVFNISGTSFGAVSANAIMALNRGAKAGNFAHNTGEGSLSRYHRKYGGDIIWQIATGYFGCRTKDGRFDPESFAAQAANPQIKMIEVKLSQGAKPGHGGVLPKAKITAEIARTRGVPRDRDCVSPSRHSEFATPLEFVAFIDRLRGLAKGKPVGMKLCVGHRFEFFAIVKAMLATGITPDFIVVDGKEGGTGAAPVEFVNHVGMPMADGLSFVHNTLVGADLRDKVKVGASGRIISAYDVLRACALGADFVLAARAFMFAVGCVQARSCHTNRCPTGVATQDKGRQRALVVRDKYKRVANFHHNTLDAVAEVVAAAGLSHPHEIKPWHLRLRRADGRVLRGDRVYMSLAPGALLRGAMDDELKQEWMRAQAESFEPLTSRWGQI